MQFHELCLEEATSTSMDLLACVFGLKKLELEIYSRLLIEGECRQDRLQTLVGRDTSGISRALGRLAKTGLLLSRRCGREGGGYFNCYEALPPAEVAELMRTRMDRFHRRLQHNLEAWAPRLEEAASHLISSN